jgi:DNA-binding ferritin-like protein (Dps family)
MEQELIGVTQKPTILTFSEMCETLKVTPSTLRKRWKELPHFLVGTGQQVDSARFVLEKVMEYLEEHHAGKRQQARNVHSKVRISGASLPETRIRDNPSGKGLGGGRKAEAKVPASCPTSTRDKTSFRILSGFSEEIPRGLQGKNAAEHGKI